MTEIEIKTYDLALQTPYRWSKGTQHSRKGLILRLEAAGAMGWGEAALPPHVDYPVREFAAECRSLMAGLDPLADDFLHELDLRECPARIRCGISTAVLSLRAAQAGLPLAAYLMDGQGRPPGMERPPRSLRSLSTSRPACRSDSPGTAQSAGTEPCPGSSPEGAIRSLGRPGGPDTVPVNDLIGDADPRQCAQRAVAAVSGGMSTVKVKCTPERELDLRRIAAIREAAPDVKIRLDPNESWPLEWAAEQLRAMEQFRIEYCEEPLPRGTPLADYGRLRKQTAVPIALDDSIRTLRDVELAAHHGAADVLILKAQRVGGPDRLLAIVRQAAGFGLACTVTSSLESSVGLYLGIHCAAMTAEPVAPAGIGTARYFAENVGPPPAIEQGRMRVPRTPGLGFDPEDWWSRA